MSITVAKTAGFCYGVKRAVDAVYDAVYENIKNIENGGQGRIATLGQLIHNRQVVSDLESHGVVVYDNVEDVPSDVNLIIRTHGITKQALDIIKNKNIKYYDLTCPFVAKIHKIVQEHYEKGYQIVIVGDENHPEVIGINGWCNNSAVILYSCDDTIFDKIAQKKVCIVAQTTINREIFEQIVQFIKKTCKEVLFFDTICNATKDRQSEVSELAEKSDLMIVIGGKESSNTRKLFEISKSKCPSTFHIETFEDLPQNIYYKNKKIGITAGASTPHRIIEEVYSTMANNETMENFAELMEESIQKTIKSGEVVTGTVFKVNDNEVIVNLGVKSDGIISLEDLTDDTTAKPSDLVKEGEEIKVYVIRVNDAEGKINLSRKAVVAQESWIKIKEACESKAVLEGKVVQDVKGGVMVLAEGNKVFVPARQASDRYIQDLTSLVGTTVKFRVIECEEKPDRRSGKMQLRALGSIRSVLEEQKKAVEDKFWADVEAGKEYTGTVKSITDFGAFVDIGGVDGLVHISELSWTKIKHPSEVVKVGDVLKVYIKDLNAETKKISLGYKKQEDNPWMIAKSKYNVGDTVSCKIVRMMPFGAFAEIMPTVDGLIHISQIADKRIGKPDDVLSVGQVVDAKITDANWDEKKISLSIRALIAPTEEVAEEATAETEE